MKKSADLTESTVISIIRNHGAYVTNPWRAPRQHTDLLEGLERRGLLRSRWGRKHCVEYRFTHIGEARV